MLILEDDDCRSQRELNGRTSGMRFKKMIEGRGGWCDWQAPIPKGYLMKCCDCGLVHEMQFKTFIETRQKRNGRFEMVEMPWPVRVLFRARRQRK